jgi:NADH:ubiquinone reductase (H+-translocating)
MNGVKKRVIVLGAGFGGLEFCKRFEHPDAEVLVVDRQNHHLFQPLLYQVATAGLSAPEIAQPIRAILRDRPRLQVCLGNIEAIHPGAREVVVDGARLPYDFLIFALGGRTSYFGHPEWECFAPGLKSLDDAQRIRREALLAFERAETSLDPAEQVRLTTLVVIGGGPTGVEMAGAFAELARYVLRRDFRRIDPGRARVVLVEGGQRLLAQFPPDLGEAARERLEAMGVEVRLATHVTAMEPGVVVLPGERIEAGVVVWAAGVAASPRTADLGAPLDKAGRVDVLPDLSIPGRPEIFVIGDAARHVGPGGAPTPGVSPAAMQQGGYVADRIRAVLDGVDPASMAPFAYWDKGSMATIGRSAAVAVMGPFRFTGFPAWAAWLFVHLIFLIGFRNKVAVLWQWFYAYLTYRRGARIFTGLRWAEPIPRSVNEKPGKPPQAGSG